MRVYYAIDTSPEYTRYLGYSVNSLRFYSPRVPVSVFCFGKPSRDLQRLLSRLDVNLVCQPEYPPNMSWSLKWVSLAFQKSEKDLLFVDADTFFFDKAEKLFQPPTESNFFAMREYAIDKEEWRGPQKLSQRVNGKQLNDLRGRVNSKHIPVFNTSVMLFREFIHRDFVKDLPLYVDLMHLWLKKKLPLSVSPKPMIEEVLASVILGRSPNLKYQFWNPSRVTNFNSWFYEAGSDVGTVMHIGHGYLIQWMELFGLIKESKRLSLYLKKIQADPRSHKQRLRIS